MLGTGITKKILVLGATGRTGMHVVDYALAKGYDVYAFARNIESFKISNPKLHLVTGNTENLADVTKAVSVVDDVISVINNPRTSDNPWAKVVGQPHMIRDSIKNVISAMKAQRKRRLIVMSTYGAGESFGYLPWWLRFIVNSSNLKVAFDDHTGQEIVLKESNLDWTIVRCVQLSDTNRIGKLVVSVNNSPKPAAKIGRKHVAKFLVQQLESSEYTHKIPIISET